MRAAAPATCCTTSGSCGPAAHVESSRSISSPRGSSPATPTPTASPRSRSSARPAARSSPTATARKPPSAPRADTGLTRRPGSLTALRRPAFSVVVPSRSSTPSRARAGRLRTGSTASWS
jgi:hypothetical protein